MARQSGPIKISGTLGDITFYKTRWGYFARKKSSLSGKRVKREKKFARSMENAGEFGSVVGSGKVVRDGLVHLLKDTKDSYVNARMNGLFSRIQKMDGVSERGKRHVGKGLQTEAGKKMLKGFEFNEYCSLVQLSRKKAVVSGGELLLNAVKADRDITWPKGANGVELRACILDVDLVQEKFTRHNTGILRLMKDAGITDVVLTAGALPAYTGNRLYVVKCCYFKEANGVRYYFKDRKWNAAGVVEVE